MLKEVACAGRVDTPRDRKCNGGVADLNDWARSHRQSQQKRSKSNGWEHFAFELLATMRSARALYPRLSTSNHMDSPAILFSLRTWNMPFFPERPPPALMIMLPYVTICSQITYSGVKS